jgi:hypothetical protein
VSAALTNEDWTFDSLLKSAPVTTIRICRLYEYAREVAAWTENPISLGQLVMLVTCPQLFSALYGFCVNKPSPDWLRVPYFRLSSRIRGDLLSLYNSHLAGLLDPTHPLQIMPFLPVGSGPPFAADEGRSQQLRLDIPLIGSNQFRRECFDALLRRRFGSQQEEGAGEGGQAEIRLLKNHLRYLGALRLLRHMSVREAARHTTGVLGRSLYAHPSDWSRAKGEAAKIIKSFEDELRPIKELFAQAPEDITWAHYDPATGKFEYGS